MSKKIKKPIYKNWWFWLIIIVVFLGSALNNDDSGPEQVTNDNILEQQEENEDYEAEDETKLEMAYETEPEMVYTIEYDDCVASGEYMAVTFRGEANTYYYLSLNEHSNNHGRFPDGVGRAKSDDDGFVTWNFQVDFSWRERQATPIVLPDLGFHMFNREDSSERRERRELILYYRSTSGGDSMLARASARIVRNPDDCS